MLNLKWPAYLLVNKHDQAEHTPHQYCSPQLTWGMDISWLIQCFFLIGMYTVIVTCKTANLLHWIYQEDVYKWWCHNLDSLSEDVQCGSLVGCNMWRVERMGDTKHQHMELPETMAKWNMIDSCMRLTTKETLERLCL